LSLPAWAAGGGVGDAPGGLAHVAQLEPRVAALRIEAQVLADGMERLADSLHTLPAAREHGTRTA